jgi:putative ABC transport system permease protein
LNKNCRPEKAETQIKHYLGRRLNFDPDDSNALHVFNFEQQVKSFQKLFTGLNVFLWFIGICLLLSGMVGVSNIMFVIVNERTREMGIRKAVGAKRKHILAMILSESAAITLLAGLIGIVLGTGVLSLVEYGLQKLLDKDFLIKETSINWGTVIGALVILIISGVIAGLIPAQKAAGVEPVEAMRTE